MTAYYDAMGLLRRLQPSTVALSTVLAMWVQVNNLPEADKRHCRVVQS